MVFLLPRKYVGYFGEFLRENFLTFEGISVSTLLAKKDVKDVIWLSSLYERAFQTRDVLEYIYNCIYQLLYF
jgi:hypothetical protein